MRLCVVLALLAAASAFPVVRYTGDSHYEFGYRLGLETAAMIADRYDTDSSLGKAIEWAESNAAVLNSYLATHQQVFPEFMEELQGMADGAGQSFERVFIANIQEELSYFVPGEAAARVDHCSDYLVSNSKAKIGGHNEDSGQETLNNTLIISATIGNDPPFTCYAYAGELPTVAFGVNGAGIGFTLNYVKPTTSWVRFGTGRNFLSRAVLAAPDWNSALAVLTSTGQGSGHSLFDFTNKVMANVESAGDRSTVVFPTATGPLFHANLYLHLNVAQVPDLDSQHRDARAAALPKPTNRTGITRVLGDTTDGLGPPYFPIYQSGGDGLFTMATAFYDLNACTIDVVTGNPLTSPQHLAKWAVESCTWV